MDVLLPKTDRDIMTQRAACICSILRGEVPYNRSLGLNANLDASVPREAQVLLGDAAMQVEKCVPGAKVTRGSVSTSKTGRAVVYLSISER